MQLTPQQLKEFDEQGFRSLASCFSEEEVGALRAEAEKILSPGSRRGVARIVRRAAHRLCGPHLQ